LDYCCYETTRLRSRLIQAAYVTTLGALCPKRESFEINLVPRVFSLFKMAAAPEKTLAHSRSRVSNEHGDVFKMAATAKRVRRTGYEMLR